MFQLQGSSARGDILIWMNYGRGFQTADPLPTQTADFRFSNNWSFSDSSFAKEINRHLSIPKASPKMLGVPLSLPNELRRIKRTKISFWGFMESVVTFQRIFGTVKMDKEFVDKWEDLMVEKEVTSVGVEAEVEGVEDLPIFTLTLTVTTTKYIYNSYILLQALRISQSQILRSREIKTKVIRSRKTQI